MSVTIENHDQLSDEWFTARLGVPTASKFKEVLAGEKTSTHIGYINKLAAEIVTGVPQKEIYSKKVHEYMDRGKEFEDEARTEYIMQTGSIVDSVGLVKRDGVGCSPDGLIHIPGTERGQITAYSHGLEIKVPLPGTHIGWLWSGKCPPQHWAQVQGSMMVSGLPRWDFVSYCPEMRAKGRAIMIVEVKRDEAYIKTLRDIVNKFIYDVHQRVRRAT